MKRDQLKELGLSDEQIKAVMDINGEDINKAKSNNDEMIKENEALKSQLTERDKDFAKLKKTAKDNEELSQQLQDLQGKYKQDHDNLTQELAKVKLNGAIDSALTSSKVRNTKAFKALLDMDTIKLDESGKLSGLDSQIESIRKSDPYLFDAGQKSACLCSRYDFNWIPRFRRGDELCILHSPSSEYFTCINLFSNGNS